MSFTNNRTAKRCIKSKSGACLPFCPSLATSRTSIRQWRAPPNVCGEGALLRIHARCSGGMASLALCASQITLMASEVAAGELCTKPAVLGLQLHNISPKKCEFNQALLVFYPATSLLRCFQSTCTRMLSVCVCTYRH